MGVSVPRRGVKRDPSSETKVVWHDLECGTYRADLALWRRLALDERGPVLDVGAGTGRVSLDLAAAGHEVVALDSDADLLDGLVARAEGRPVRTVCADARSFRLDRSFGLIIVPMQTIQLLGGPRQRARFLMRAKTHLYRGGLLACALVGELTPFEAGGRDLLADIREVRGTLYSSRPVAIRRAGQRMALERVRETVAPSGLREVATDVVCLDRLDPRTLSAEAARHRLRSEPARQVAATDEHVASQVVMLRG